MLEQAFKKWELSIRSYLVEEDFLWCRPTYNYLLGPFPGFAGKKIQDGNKTQKVDGHTPVSDDDYGTMCASSVDVAHSDQKE